MKRRSYAIKGLILASDALLAAVALVGAYLIRFDLRLWPDYQEQLARLLPIVILVRLTALYYLGGYRTLWRYTSLSDLVRLVQGVLLGSLVLVVINYFRNYPLGTLIAVFFLGSAVAHRTVLVMRHSGQRLAMSLLIGGGLILAAGLYAFTVLNSAPVSLSSMPLAEPVVAQDFREAQAMPRAVVVLEAILAFMLLGGARLAPRLGTEVYTRSRAAGRRVLVFGAGDAGEHLVRAMVNQPQYGYHPVGFIDDQPVKLGLRIHGVEVLGTRADLQRLLERHKVEEVMISIGDLSHSDLREVAAVCWQRRIPVRRVPSFARLLDGHAGLQSLEQVDLEGLLGRAEVELDPARVMAYLRGRTVLVTGAGGSIGSELCRQISRCRPAQLILLGRGENSIYQIEHDLASVSPDQKTICQIGDIGHPGRMEAMFRTYRPEVVFHAAAHKHVPFMEDAPEEAARNNVFGTLNLARLAQRYGVDRFVLISSDKAVYPSSIMGTTKKVAELVLQHLAPRGTTQFVTVRFGNVLRSRGSVVPFFEQQIRDGGPVTVTHPEMTRYFMSIPEAVRLVLHSGAVGTNGDLCILEMGEPVRIATLAENMIRLAGKRPHEEIEIAFTGIRPGEKLAEELFTQEEARTLRKVDKILLSRPEGCDWERFEARLARLREAAEASRRDEVVAVLKEIVPAYQGGVTEAMLLAGAPDRLADAPAATRRA